MNVMIFFFFKQKTAYEMRISDWSSDVCSSDLWPGMEEGKFGVCTGPIMASSNYFRIVISGKGAHAAMPHMGIDPIMAATQLVQALQTIVTRNRNPYDPAVLSLTQIHARSEEHTSELQSLMRISYAVFCLKKKKITHT